MSFVTNQISYVTNDVRVSSKKETGAARIPFYLSLLLISLVIEPTALFRFEVAGFQVTSFELLLALCVAATLTDLRHLPPARPARRDGPVLLLIGFAIFACLSAILFREQAGLLFDLRVVLNFAEELVMVALMAYHLRTLGQVRTALNVLLMTVVVAAAANILQGQGWVNLGFDTTYRQGMAKTIGGFVIGTRGLDDGVMAYGELFLAAFPIALLLSRNTRMRGLLRVVFAGLIVVAVIVTFSRSVWLAMAAQLLLAAILFPAMSTRRPRPLLVVLIAAVGAAAVIRWGSAFFSWLVRLRPDSYAERIDLYGYGFGMMSQHVRAVLFGLGKGGIYDVTQGIVHNLFLDVFFSNGLFVLLAMAAIFVLVAARLLQSYRLARLSRDKEQTLVACTLMLMLSGMLAHGMSAPTSTSKPLWITIGITLAFVAVVHGRRAAE